MIKTTIKHNFKFTFTRIFKTKIYLLFFVFYLFNISPAYAAERIKFNYGPLALSVSVESLAVFAEEGKINPELAFYLNRFSTEKQVKFRQFLQTRYQVNYLVVYRFARTSVGKKLLSKIGELIQTKGGRNGFYGIRGALVQAAMNSEGVSIIDFLRKFPTDIELNTREIIKVLKEFSSLSRETDQFMAQIAQITADNAISESRDNRKQLIELAQATQLKIEPKTLEFIDNNRQRKLLVDFYLPKKENLGKIPVIFIANGIGARRNRFSKLAQNLATQGFAVIIPDNPGSSHQRQQDFFQGLYQENFAVEEFINLPLDISYILNQLEIINPEKFQNQLNLEQVGVFGYSFGGSTALSLAGAKINFEQLEKDCVA